MSNFKYQDKIYYVQADTIKEVIFSEYWYIDMAYVNINKLEQEVVDIHNLFSSFEAAQVAIKERIIKSIEDAAGLIEEKQRFIEEQQKKLRQLNKTLYL